MTGRRTVALAVIAVVLALATLAAGYVKPELAESEPFGDRVSKRCGPRRCGR